MDTPKTFRQDGNTLFPIVEEMAEVEKEAITVEQAVAEYNARIESLNQAVDERNALDTDIKEKIKLLDNKEDTIQSIEEDIAVWEPYIPEDMRAKDEEDDEPEEEEITAESAEETPEEPSEEVPQEE